MNGKAIDAACRVFNLDPEELKSARSGENEVEATKVVLLEALEDIENLVSLEKRSYYKRRADVPPHKDLLYKMSYAAIQNQYWREQTIRKLTAALSPTRNNKNDQSGANSRARRRFRKDEDTVMMSYAKIMHKMSKLKDLDKSRIQMATSIKEALHQLHSSGFSLGSSSSSRIADNPQSPVKNAVNVNHLPLDLVLSLNCPPRLLLATSSTSSNNSNNKSSRKDHNKKIQAEGRVEHSEENIKELVKNCTDSLRNDVKRFSGIEERVSTDIKEETLFWRWMNQAVKKSNETTAANANDLGDLNLNVAELKPFDEEMTKGQAIIGHLEENAHEMLWSDSLHSQETKELTNIQSDLNRIVKKYIKDDGSGNRDRPILNNSSHRSHRDHLGQQSLEKVYLSSSYPGDISTSLLLLRERHKNTFKTVMAASESVCPFQFVESSIT